MNTLADSINKCVPMIYVPDVAAALDWYASIGFREINRYAEDNLVNFGMDADITPKFRTIANVNFLWFDQTEAIEQFIFQDGVHNFIGADLSIGAEYRPRLSNNIIITGGFLALNPGSGFKALYDNLDRSVPPMVAGFVNLNLTF